MSGRPHAGSVDVRRKRCGPAHVDGSEGSEGTTKTFLPSVVHYAVVGALRLIAGTDYALRWYDAHLREGRKG